MKAGLIGLAGMSLAVLALAPVNAAQASHVGRHKHLSHRAFHHRHAGSSHALRVPAGEGVGSIRELIAKHAAANGVPFELADAVVRIESRYRPQARNGGAVGLMQIKPATARGVGFAGSTHDLYATETNLRFGMKYLAEAYRLSGGDVCHTVMRYQSGTYSSHMSSANRVYCSRARAIMAEN